MRSSRALFAVVAAACLAVAAAQTKGTTLRGYTFTTDVSEYLGISQDICDIRKVLNRQEPGYKEAQTIYLDGKNAKRKDGSSLLTMRRLAIGGSNNDLPFWNQYSSYYKNPVWIDDVVNRALIGLAPYQLPVQRVQLIVKSLESSLQMATVMHRLDQAVALTKAGKKDEAHRVLDSAWAIFVGGNPDCGLWTVTMKRANEYGTKKDCETSNAAYNIRDAFLAAQKAINAGNAEAVLKARDTVQANLAAVYTQATITYAHEMYLDKAANVSAAEHQTEAYAFFRTIAPIVDKGNPKAAEALDFWLFPGQPVINDVDLAAARAFSSAYKGMGVNKEMVGQYGNKQEKLGCLAYVPQAGSGGGILSSTEAKDSLRSGDAAAAPKDAAPKDAAPKNAAAAKDAAPKNAAPKDAAPKAAAPSGRRLRALSQF